MTDFREGIVFGMDEDDYHAVPALSASGVKHLRQSPLNFWAQSWLNPAPEEEDREESFARIVGRAYHKRILEGRDKFVRCYAPELEKSAYTDLLVTMDDLRGELERLGLPKTAKRKDDAISRILEANPTARIWDALQDGYIKSHEGKVFLPQRLMSKIELSAAMIERSKKLGSAFRGGEPEVSIFWIEPKTLCPCKARVDYLKPKAIVDLKTFENTLGREVGRAVDVEFANRRYGGQAVWYTQAVEAAIGLILEDKVEGDVSSEFLAKLMHANPAERKFLFVFQQKGPAPIARGKILNRHSAVFQIWEAHLEANRRTFMEYLSKFGTEPWVDDADIEEFQDDELPIWATE